MNYNFIYKTAITKLLFATFLDTRWKKTTTHTKSPRWSSSPKTTTTSDILQKHDNQYAWQLHKYSGYNYTVYTYFSRGIPLDKLI